jgi:hypothetical protein
MRIHIGAVLGLISVAAANAGQIQLGGVNGLTSAYINQTAGAGQAACAAGAGNCLAGSTTGYVERNYDARLFASATENGTAPTPYASYNQTTAEVGTLGQFAMINDGTALGASANYWNANNGDNTIIVPVGISNVTDVQTMLNDLWGGAGANDTVVTFDYGTSSNASSFNKVVVVDLQNAPSGTSSSSSGQIGSAIVCSSSPCTYANGDLAGQSDPTTILNSGAANLVVTTGTLFSSAYNGGITGFFAGTSGDTVLDDQDFELAALVAPSSSEYLVNIEVTELNGASTGSAASQTALSAIDIDTVPEPSTVVLFLGGLGALGFAKFRKR